jgi:2,3-dihydroxyphenylpropionate 1,2-dioxygenase
LLFGPPAFDALPNPISPATSLIWCSIGVDCAIALGLKTVILSSGGMSHFPGTDRYSNPELAWDKRALEKLAAANLKSLIGYDETELDDTGNIELRCWACAAGALGERKPDVVSFDPSWHHNYASLAWVGGEGSSAARRIIPRSSPNW